MDEGGGGGSRRGIVIQGHGQEARAISHEIGLQILARGASRAMDGAACVCRANFHTVDELLTAEGTVEGACTADEVFHGAGTVTASGVLQVVHVTSQVRLHTALLQHWCQRRHVLLVDGVVPCREDPLGGHASQHAISPRHVVRPALLVSAIGAALCSQLRHAVLIAVTVRLGHVRRTSAGGVQEQDRQVCLRDHHTVVAGGQHPAGVVLEVDLGGNAALVVCRDDARGAAAQTCNVSDGSRAGAEAARAARESDADSCDTNL